ncbi:hypothetical protein [Stutzerimonas kunmingensis]|uniref:hypothetical protein n=1 Tax=Stutzerimonas kunmingensis TaxID=1211807 RepID=UPI00241FC548|nr:hypothetical protein [Stutzerimonas kunmingensis]
MISKATRERLFAAVENPTLYCSGSKRKQLQVTYDKLLDELSNKLFNEPCSNRMVFRQKVNAANSQSSAVKALKNMLRKQEFLFSKDYRDHAVEINSFLTNDLARFLEALSGD